MTGDPPLRRCTLCGVEKPATTQHFYANRRMKDGLVRQCIPCVTERERARRLADPAGNRERRKGRYYANHEARKAERRDYYAKNKERILAQQSASIAERRDDVLARRRAARLADADRRRAADREYRERRKEAGTPITSWRQRDPEAARAYQRDYYPGWLAASPKRRLAHSMAVLMSRSLREGTDGASWEALVGYTRADLARHLERQFAEGMTWAAYGEWHVEHVLPIRMFAFETSDDPDFRACYALSNLRPLWAVDNLRKGQSREYLL